MAALIELSDMEVAATPPGRGWRTGQDRTRLLVAYLWDGRCGRCRKPLVRVAELGLSPLPMDIDHVRPRVHGGHDELMNYMASCAACNRSRQARDITDEHTICGIFRARHALLDDFEDYWEHATMTDPAFAMPFWTGLRCADHRWHISGSPAARECRARLVSGGRPVPLLDEWWWRFGSRTPEVFEAACSTFQRDTVNDLDSRRILGHLPRYALNAEHALKLLRAGGTPSSYHKLTPAPSHLLSITVPLAETTTVASKRRRDHAAALQLHRHLQDEAGIDWFGIARLWTERHWPSSHLIFYRSAVLGLAASGKRKALADLAGLDSGRDVEQYLIAFHTHHRRAKPQASVGRRPNRSVAASSPLPDVLLPL